MVKHLLTESHRFIGRWHVLGHEHEALPGELTYDPEMGLRLEVVGLFGGFPGSMREGDPYERHPVILGSTSKHQITLFNCAQVNQQINIPGVGSTTFRAVFAVVGTQADGADLPTVDEMVVRIPLLDAWHPVSGLGMQMTQTPEMRLEEYATSYTPPSTIEADLPWGQIRIVPAANFHHSNSTVDRTASITEWLDVSIVLTAEESIDVILNERISPLVDLATLLTSYPAQITYLGLQAQVVGLDDEPIGMRETMDVLFQPSFAGTPAPAKVDEGRFLLPPNADDCPKTEELLTRWFACRDRLKRSMDMLFGMERSPRGTYTEVRFLTLCHAAEAMHRDQPLPQERWSKQEYKVLQASALGAVADEEAKAFLKEQLKYAKDLTLRDRLRALRDMALEADADPPVISDAVLARIVKARNNLTHSSTKDLARIEDSPDLYYLAQYVVWLMRACFLIELGLTREQVTARVRASDQFRWLQKSFTVDDA